MGELSALHGLSALHELSEVNEFNELNASNVLTDLEFLCFSRVRFAGLDQSRQRSVCLASGALV